MVTVLDTRTAPAERAVKPLLPTVNVGKFNNPDVTLKGEKRAKLTPKHHGGFKTVWFNTGTLCNIECDGCYIESGPKNDRLEYIKYADVVTYLDEIDAHQSVFNTETIALTGGEPCMNPDIIPIMTTILARGFKLLLLTNAMQPMQNKAVWNAIKALTSIYGGKMIIRVSIDHYSQVGHEAVRGDKAWAPMIKGLQMLSELNQTKGHAFQLDIAGHKPFEENHALDAANELEYRENYKTLFAAEGIDVPADRSDRLVLFPKMDGSREVPEITTACWNILDKKPSDLMCASEPTIVRRKGAKQAEVTACTLIPYDEEFKTGNTLLEALNATISLNHAMCATCMLSGVSCSG